MTLTCPLVFVCGHRKAGTTLFQNLLDGHPQLAVYPVDLTLLYAYFPEFVAKHADPTARRTRLQRILFDELHERLGAPVSSGRLDIDAMSDRFFNELDDAMLGDVGALIERLATVFVSVLDATAGSVRRFVFKETSIEIYAREIAGWFPDARFIHVVRDPRDNFAALAAGVDLHYARIGEDHNTTLASLIHRARLGLALAEQNRAQFGDENYMVVRFEDLIRDPEQTMRTVSGFLGVDMRDNLLKPTLLGSPTGGNNYDGDRKFTVDAANIGRWKERLVDRDAQVIEFHLQREMEAFGYALEYPAEERATAAAEFYKWQNYRFFHADRFERAPAA